MPLISKRFSYGDISNNIISIGLLMLILILFYRTDSLDKKGNLQYAFAKVVSKEDSTELRVLQKKNDSLINQSQMSAAALVRLEKYAKKQDSLVEIKSDSLRMANVQNYYLRQQTKLNDTYLKELRNTFLTNQSNLKETIWRMSTESDTLQMSIADLKVTAGNIVDSTRLIKQVIAELKYLTQSGIDSLKVKPPTKKEIRAKKKSTSRSSVNEKRRKRKAERQTRKKRRRSLQHEI